MTHPGVYVVTIGIAIGAALLTYFMSNREQYEPVHRPMNRTFDSLEEGHRCTICLENISNFDKRVLRCRHTFHERCIKRWFETKVSCPNCRL